MAKYVALSTARHTRDGMGIVARVARAAAAVRVS
jgi:hypothetical protein